MYYVEDGKLKVLQETFLIIRRAYLQIMFPMMGTSAKNKLSIDGTNNESKYDNEEIIQIQDRCYEDLMDLCRTMAESLNIKANSIMTIQVITYSFNFNHNWKHIAT